MRNVNKYNFSDKEKQASKKVNEINNSNLKKNLTNLINVFNKK